MEHKQAAGQQGQCHLPVPELSVRQLGQRGACGTILLHDASDSSSWWAMGHLGRDSWVSVDSGLCTGRTHCLCSALTRNKETKEVGEGGRHDGFSQHRSASLSDLL